MCVSGPHVFLRTKNTEYKAIVFAHEDTCNFTGNSALNIM